MYDRCQELEKELQDKNRMDKDFYHPYLICAQYYH